jgi:hypothetical protein
MLTKAKIGQYVKTAYDTSMRWVYPSADSYVVFTDDGVQFSDDWLGDNYLHLPRLVLEGKEKYVYIRREQLRLLELLELLEKQS